MSEQVGPPFSEAQIEIAVTHVLRQEFIDQLSDDMVPLTMVATPDQMKAVEAGVRLVFDAIDEYGYQIVAEDGHSLNPPNEEVDFRLTTLWDNYVDLVNS